MAAPIVGPTPDRARLTPNSTVTENEDGYTIRTQQGNQVSEARYYAAGQGTKHGITYRLSYERTLNAEGQPLSQTRYQYENTRSTSIRTTIQDQFNPQGQITRSTRSEGLSLEAQAKKRQKQPETTKEERVVPTGPSKEPKARQILKEARARNLSLQETQSLALQRSPQARKIESEIFPQKGKPLSGEVITVAPTPSEQPKLVRTPPPYKTQVFATTTESILPPELAVREYGPQPGLKNLGTTSPYLRKREGAGNIQLSPNVKPTTRAQRAQNILSGLDERVATKTGPIVRKLFDVQGTERLAQSAKQKEGRFSVARLLRQSQLYQIKAVETKPVTEAGIAITSGVLFRGAGSLGSQIIPKAIRPATTSLVGGAIAGAYAGETTKEFFSTDEPGRVLGKAELEVTAFKFGYDTAGGVGGAIKTIAKPKVLRTALKAPLVLTGAIATRGPAVRGRPITKAEKRKISFGTARDARLFEQPGEKGIRIRSPELKEKFVKELIIRQRQGGGGTITTKGLRGYSQQGLTTEIGTGESSIQKQPSPGLRKQYPRGFGSQAVPRSIKSDKNELILIQKTHFPKTRTQKTPTLLFETPKERQRPVLLLRQQRLAKRLEKEDVFAQDIRIPRGLGGLEPQRRGFRPGQYERLQFRLAEQKRLLDLQRKTGLPIPQQPTNLRTTSTTQPLGIREPSSLITTSPQQITYTGQQPSIIDIPKSSIEVLSVQDVTPKTIRSTILGTGLGIGIISPQLSGVDIGLNTKTSPRLAQSQKLGLQQVQTQTTAQETIFPEPSITTTKPPKGPDIIKPPTITPKIIINPGPTFTPPGPGRIKGPEPPPPPPSQPPDTTTFGLPRFRFRQPRGPRRPRTAFPLSKSPSILTPTVEAIVLGIKAPKVNTKLAKTGLSLRPIRI